MSRYVIESGVTHPGSAPMWTVVDRGISDPILAYRFMVARALSMRVLYEPHGGRKLRVRQEDTR